MWKHSAPHWVVNKCSADSRTGQKAAFLESEAAAAEKTKQGSKSHGNCRPETEAYMFLSSSMSTMFNAPLPMQPVDVETCWCHISKYEIGNTPLKIHIKHQKTVIKDYTIYLDASLTNLRATNFISTRMPNINFKIDFINDRLFFSVVSTVLKVVFVTTAPLSHAGAWKVKKVSLAALHTSCGLEAHFLTSSYSGSSQVMSNHHEKQIWISRSGKIMSLLPSA